MSMTLSICAEARDPVVGADRAVAAVQRARGRRVEDVVDERALARARDAGHADEEARAGTRRRRPCRLFSRAPFTVIVRPSPLPPLGRQLDRQLAAEVAAGEAGLRPRDLGRRAAATISPPWRPGAGAEVDEPVRLLHRLAVVLDDHDRVADVAQVLEGGEQLAVVALVQADRRLVEHVDDAGQLGADLAGEADALALAAGERRRRAVERQVGEAHVEQEAQARADLLQQLRGDLGLRALQLERVEEGVRLGDRERGHSAIVRPAIFTPSASRRTRRPPHAEHGREERYFW